MEIFIYILTILCFLTIIMTVIVCNNYKNQIHYYKEREKDFNLQREIYSGIIEDLINGDYEEINFEDGKDNE